MTARTFQAEALVAIVCVLVAIVLVLDKQPWLARGMCLGAIAVLFLVAVQSGH